MFDNEGSCVVPASREHTAAGVTLRPISQPIRWSLFPMRPSPDFLATEPTRAAIDGLSGAAVIEFGTPWCGHCRAAQGLIAEAFNGFEDIVHLRIEDGPGRRLGRSFKVKLWPTLVFLRDGVEVARCVRPDDVALIAEALARVTRP
jgi:thioredoxin 1